MFQTRSFTFILRNAGATRMPFRWAVLCGVDMDASGLYQVQGFVHTQTAGCTTWPSAPESALEPQTSLLLSQTSMRMSNFWHRRHTTSMNNSIMLPLLSPGYMLRPKLTRSACSPMQVAPESGTLAPGEEVAMEVQFCPKEVVDCDRCSSKFIPSQALAVMNYGFGKLCVLS